MHIIGDRIKRPRLIQSDLYWTAPLLHEAGVRLKNPSATDCDVVKDWLSMTLEPELLREYRESRAERS